MKMHKLISKRTFKQRCNKLIKKHHSLISGAQFNVPPGWLNLLSTTLESFIKVVGSQTIANTQIILMSEQNNQLKIIADFPNSLSPNRIEAVNYVLEIASESSKSTCQKCGAKLQKGSNSWSFAKCNNHDEFEGQFIDDLKASILNDHALAEMQNTDPIIDNPEKSDLSNQNESTKTNQLKIFDKKELENLKNTINNSSVDADVKNRNKTIFSNMLKRGESLPFGQLPEKDSIQLDTLLENFPNFEETIKVIRNAIELARIGDGRFKIPNILLLGAPGIGKTYFANQAAKILNIDFLEIKMENEQNGATLTGSSEFWSNTKTGEIFNLLTTGKTANPLVLVDEVDKATGDYRYDPLAGLYGLLEEETAKRFEDQSIRNLQLNASAINWLLTANSIDNIPAPIKSRMIIHEIKSPNLEQSLNIAKNIYKILRETNAWGNHFAEDLCDAAATKLAKHEPRKMKTILRNAFGEAARNGAKIITETNIMNTVNALKNKIGFI